MNTTTSKKKAYPTKIHTHIIMEMMECEGPIIDSAVIEIVVHNAIAAGGFSHYKTLSYVFPGGGASVVGILGESHISIHTYPESNSVLADVFGYAEKDCLASAERIKQWARPGIVRMQIVDRFHQPKVLRQYDEKYAKARCRSWSKKDKKEIVSLHKRVFESFKFKEKLSELKVLHVGCEEGYLFEEYSQQGISKVVGYDVNPFVIRACRGKERIAVLGDGVKLPFSDNFFDFAVSLDVMEHLTRNEVRAYVKEILRIAPMAIIGVTLGTKVHFFYDESHELAMTEKQWFAFLKNCEGVDVVLIEHNEKESYATYVVERKVQ